MVSILKQISRNSRYLSRGSRLVLVNPVGLVPMVILNYAIVTFCVGQPLSVLLEGVVERFVVQKDVIVARPPVESIFHLLHGIHE